VLSGRDRAVAAIRARIVPETVPASCPRHGSDGPAECCLNPFPGLGVLTVQALRVDPEQDFYRVPGPLSYLSGRHATVEPRGDAGVP